MIDCCWSPRRGGRCGRFGCQSISGGLFITQRGLYPGKVAVLETAFQEESISLGIPVSFTGGLAILIAGNVSGLGWDFGDWLIVIWMVSRN